MKNVRQLMVYFENDDQGEELGQFVKEVERHEHRMMFGLNNDTTLDMDDTEIKEQPYNYPNRKSSMDAILGPMSKVQKRNDVINTSDSIREILTPTKLISVSRMSSLEEYDRILESDDESRSSYRDSFNISQSSEQRARNKDLKESNIFLMKVIHGRVPNELLTSRITSTDRENLSTLIPQLV